MPGYVNVDLREDCGDFVADVTKLPFPDESVEEIQAIDLLEHFPATQTQAVLGEWRRVLEKKGTMILRVPNLQVLGSLMAKDDEHIRHYIRNIYGGHRWGENGSLDTHHTGWTFSLLERELEQAQFRVVERDYEPNMRVECERV